jgi:osmotically-inducible protein OsmY
MHQIMMPQDDLIQARVELRLARSGSLRGTDIHVDVDDRVATLRGTVGSEQEQERAIQMTRRVTGVRDVKSNLNIDTEAVDQRRQVEVDDHTLKRQVAEKLAKETFPLAEVDEGLFGTMEVKGYAREFEVEVDDGVVTLEGDVDYYQDIREAVGAVRTLPGVKAVNAELRVNYDSHYLPYYRSYYRTFDYDPRY